MNVPKNQSGEPTGLMDGIASEVSPENAPLLHFISSNASAIAGIVILLLLVLGGWGIWNWHQDGKAKEARQEMERINVEMKGRERYDALLNLAQKAPDSVKLFIYLSLAQGALESDPAESAAAYAKVAELDGDGALGMTAILAGAGSLLRGSEYQKALELLQGFSSKYPEAAKSIQFRQLLAETALKSGDRSLATQIFQELANNPTVPQRIYFESRAKSLTRDVEKKPVMDATAEQNKDMEK